MKSEPNWLNKAEYPFKNHYLCIDNHLIHYIDEGSGETLLFVHGTPSWSFDFRHLIRHLSKQYRCIAIDHIGFGLSDKPYNYKYTTQQHSENLETLITYLKLDNVTLIVHDFGGPIAFNWAVHNPDKINSIIAFNTWMWSSKDEPEFKKISKILKSPLLPLLYRYFNFSANYLLPKSFGIKKPTKWIHRHYTLPFANNKEREGTIGFAKSLLNDQEWFETIWNKRQSLNQKPKLFIWGMKDIFITSKYLDKFRETWGDSQCLKLESCGHFPQEEEPESCLNAIELFLKSSERNS